MKSEASIIKLYFLDCKVPLEQEFLNSFQGKCDIQIYEHAKLNDILKNSSPSIIFVNMSSEDSLENFLKISSSANQNIMVIGHADYEVEIEKIIDFFDAGMSDYLLGSFAAIVIEARIKTKIDQLVLTELIAQESGAKYLAATSQQKSELAKSLFKMVLGPIKDIIEFSEKKFTKENLTSIGNEINFTIENCRKISEIIIFARQLFGSFNSANTFSIDKICNLSLKLSNNSDEPGSRFSYTELEPTNIDVSPATITPFTLAMIQIINLIKSFEDSKSIVVTFTENILEISCPEIYFENSESANVFDDVSDGNSLNLCKKMLEKHPVELKIGSSTPITFQFIFSDIT